MLDIVASYHRIQFQGKRMIEKKMEKKKFGPDLGPLSPNSGRQIFFQKSGFVSH